MKSRILSTGIDRQQVQEPSDTAPRFENTRDYFHRLRRRLKIVFFLAYVLPLGILSLYFHLQFSQTLKESGKLHLTTLAESQRSTIDLFLQERVTNIFNLFHSGEFNLVPSQQDMGLYLQSLRESSDAFVDVGALNASGRQIGYAGPYPYLHGEDYSGEVWFQTLMRKKQNYHITDIYLGFRKKPHFTIAVKQILGGSPHVMRATLDPDKFHAFLQTLRQGKGMNSSLVNQEGQYQIVDPDPQGLLDLRDALPPYTHSSGSREIRTNGDTVLLAYAWLHEVPWALIVDQPLRVAYATMFRTRRIMVFSVALVVLVLFCAIWLTTDRLLRRAQRSEEARASLKSQLLHAAKLAAVGELAAGVAHEINNPLAIISSECGWILDLLDPKFGMNGSPEEIKNTVKNIDQAVYRAKNITHKLLNFARKNETQLVSCNVNQILSDVLTGIKEQEFKVNNICLQRELETDLPEVLLDPDQMRQVFLNLINNAQDAIEGPGTIRVKTFRDDGFLHIRIADTGVGMTSEEMEKIFLPFFTTKEVGKGTGLGLSVSLSIVEAMGGRMDVQSLKGAGSSFEVILPIRKSEANQDAVNGDSNQQSQRQESGHSARG